nr:MAG TPA: Mnd1 HTH domain [Caudoviricetes sp.]
MKKHSFSVEFAERFGIVEALLLDYFFFWINNSQKKKEKDKYHAGRYWVYGSVRKIAEAHPYLSRAKVHRALKKLEEAGAIKTDAFNKMCWDKTTWYTLTDEILDLSQNETGGVSKRNRVSQNETGVSQNETTIPIQTPIQTPIQEDDGENARKQPSLPGKVNQKHSERRENGRAVYTQAVECYEKNMGTIATPMLAELVQSLVDEVGLDIFCKAAEIGGRNNAKGFRYVEKVAINIKEGKTFRAPQKHKGRGNDVVETTAEALQLLESGEIIDL